MIDYRASMVALEAFRAALAAENLTEPKLVKTRAEDAASIDDNYDMALLGALTHHLIWHATSDGAELSLLERGASLWRIGLASYEKMSSMRRNLEEAAANPEAPDADEKFALARQRATELGENIEGKEIEIAVLREDIDQAAIPYPHPRQDNKRLDRWSWSDIMLARRTDAFARALLRNATPGPTRAFALGALASYGGNACGSAYLGQVVGGPRRAHRHRDRIAARSVGSWFAASNTRLPALARVAQQIRNGLPAPVLPSAIEAMVLDAMKDTYDAERTPPLPDLQLGYARLLRHLELLDVFQLPERATLPIPPFLQKIYGGDAPPPFSIVQALIEAEQTTQSNAGAGPTPQNLPQGSALGPQDSRRNSKLDCGAFFMGLFRFIALAGLLWAPCWGKSPCKLWEDMKHDFGEFLASLGGGQGAGVENTGSSGQQLTAHSENSTLTEMILALYETQRHFWETLSGAYAFLANFGLIYPDTLLGRGLFRQFLTIPVAPLGRPHLPTSDSAALAYEYPQTPIEQPAWSVASYPPGSQPNVFIASSQAGATPSASQLSLAVWSQTTRQQTDALNYDLDADRGLTHPCWAADGSIHDQPLLVAVLAYNQT